MQGLPTWQRSLVAIALAVTTLLSQGWTARGGSGPATRPSLSADDAGAVHLLALAHIEVKVTPPPAQVKDKPFALQGSARRGAPPELSSSPRALLSAVAAAAPRRHSLVGVVELRI